MSASRPSKEGIRKTKSEFIRTNTNSDFTDNRLLTPGFMGVEWTALQLDFNFLLLDFKLCLGPSRYRIFSALGSITLHKAFSDPTRCNPVLIRTFCFNKLLAYININTLSFCPTCIMTYCSLQSFYFFLQLQYVFSTTVSTIPTLTN